MAVPTAHGGPGGPASFGSPLERVPAARAGCPQATGPQAGGLPYCGMTLARGFVLRDMRAFGVRSRTGLPLRPTPRAWRVILRAPSGIRAGGVASALVIGALPLPARPGG